MKVDVRENTALITQGRLIMCLDYKNSTTYNPKKLITTNIRRIMPRFDPPKIQIYKFINCTAILY